VDGTSSGIENGAEPSAFAARVSSWLVLPCKANENNLQTGFFVQNSIFPPCTNFPQGPSLCDHFQFSCPSVRSPTVSVTRQLMRHTS
jgi:hypothetical protein